MTSGADTKVSCQDVGPTLDGVAVGTGLAIKLAQVGSRVDGHCVVYRATGSSVIVSGVIGCVAILALAVAI